jgi:hypothetical protein
LNALDTSTIECLQQQHFATEIDESFRTTAYSGEPILMSVLNQDLTQIVYDRALMTGLTRRAHKALDALSWSVSRVSKTVFLGTNDLLIIDNKRVVHGRTPFSARYDGSDRWIKRALVSNHLPPGDMIEYRHNGRDRIIHTDF